VPEWLHIGAYRHSFPITAFYNTDTKSLQMTIFFAGLVSEMGLIAMQKVESSNLFSRFARNLALGRDFVVYGGALGK